MTSHIVFKQIDPTVAATMSQTVLQGILRRQLGFDGLTVSDDLEMKAIANNYGIEQVIVRGAQAGIDLFFICHDPALQHRAIDILIKAVESGEVSRERIDDANRRIDAVVQRYYQPPVDAAMLKVVGSDEHRAVADRVAALAENVKAAPDPTESWR
jgi:beta-N-acetylhexosaminidase